MVMIIVCTVLTLLFGYMNLESLYKTMFLLVIAYDIFVAMPLISTLLGLSTVSSILPDEWVNNVEIATFFGAFELNSPLLAIFIHAIGMWVGWTIGYKIAKSKNTTA